MDNYDKDDQPYSSRWYLDFIVIGVVCLIVAGGYFLPKWLG